MFDDGGRHHDDLARLVAQSLSLVTDSRIDVRAFRHMDVPLKPVLRDAHAQRGATRAYGGANEVLARREVTATRTAVTDDSDRMIERVGSASSTAWYEARDHTRPPKTLRSRSACRSRATCSAASRPRRSPLSGTPCVAPQTLGVASKLKHVAAAQIVAEALVAKVLVGDASLRFYEPIVVVVVVLVGHAPIVAHAK
jgi:hypothetical protein